MRVTGRSFGSLSTKKNAVTKGVKAWRDRRVGYWLCIDPKTGEYYLPTSAALAELNGLKAMYRLPAVYYRIVLMRDWNVKLGPHVIGTHLDTSAYIKDLEGKQSKNGYLYDIRRG